MHIEMCVSWQLWRTRKQSTKAFSQSSTLPRDTFSLNSRQVKCVWFTVAANHGIELDVREADPVSDL